MDELERIDAHADGIKECVRILKSKTQTEPVDQERPNKGEELPKPSFNTPQNAKLLWVPFADVPFKIAGNALYRNGKGRDLMEGCVFHYAANKLVDDPYQEGLGVARWGKSQGYGFFVTCRDGTIIQYVPLNKWDSHAGSSSWKELSGRKRSLTGVSQYFGGNENCNPGRLTDAGGGKCVAWHGQKFEMSDCVHVEKKRGNIQPGYYLPLTKEQMDANTKLYLWLAHNDEFFNLDNIVGHDEVAPTRKNDPGGVVWIDDPKKPVTMREYVEHLKGLV